MADALVINPGDVVTLKSGGPAMTVEGLHDAPVSVGDRVGLKGKMARVGWLDVHGILHEAALWLHMLAKKADTAEVADSPAPPKPDERNRGPGKS